MQKILFIFLLLTAPLLAIEDQRSKPDTTRQIIAWRIYYSDSSVVRVTDSLGWLLAPTTGVVCIAEVYAESYRTWNERKWQLVNYRRLIQGKETYWRAFPRGYVWGGRTLDAPVGLPLGTLKTGALLRDIGETAFSRVYRWAWEDREKEADSVAAVVR